jgi:hypothetical protein
MRTTLERRRAVAIWSAFRYTSRRLVQARPSNMGISCLMSIAAAVLCAPLQTQARIVVVTITGTVISGGIGSGPGLTGVFGLAPGSNLAGQNYTLVYTIDDTKGTGTVFVGNPPYSSYIEGTYATANPQGDPVVSNPVTAAVLKINGVPYPFVTQPDTSVLNASMFRGCMTTPCNTLVVQSYVNELRTLPDNGEEQLSVNFSFTLPQPTGNPDWESPISYVFTNTFPATSNGSGFDIGNFNKNTGQGISATGSFSISSITISGPMMPPSGTAPQISANGVIISGLQNPVLAVVGQSIQLEGTPAAQPRQTLSWGGIDPATIVGGFQVASCPRTISTKAAPLCKGSVTSLSTSDFNSSVPSVFYWAIPGSYTVTYTVGGQTVSATVKVEAPVPTSNTFIVIPQTGLGHVDVNPPCLLPAQRLGISCLIPDFAGSYQLVLDDFVVSPDGTPLTWGIQFSPSIYSPDYNGIFEWVQLVLETTNTKAAGTTKNCQSFGTGLDATYPYAATFSDGSAVDGPGAWLPNGGSVTTVERTFYADMYLMWEPTSIKTSSNAIPLVTSIYVPLEYVSWGFDGIASRENDVWSLKSGTPQPSIVQKHVKYPKYPEWVGTTSSTGSKCPTATSP